MSQHYSGSRLILMIIGSLFSIISILLVAMIVMFLSSLEGSVPGNEIKGFLTSVAILTVTTFTISIFIWWIVFRKNWFQMQE